MRRLEWVLVLAACGGGSASLGEPRPEPGTEPEEVVELLVSPGMTGMLELEDGARAVVEDNQLTEQVLVRFERRTCAGVFRSSVFPSCLYELQAEAAATQLAFRLDLPLESQAAPSSEPCAAASQGQGFYCMTEQRSDDQRLSTTTTQSSQFAARALPVEAVDDRRGEIGIGQCDDGGIEGDWTLVTTTGTTADFGGARLVRELLDDCLPGEHVRTEPLDLRRWLTFRTEASLEMDADGGEPWQQGQYENQDTYWYHAVTSNTCLRRMGQACDTGCEMRDGVCECLQQSGGGISSGSLVWRYGEVPGTVEFEGRLHNHCLQGERLFLVTERSQYDEAGGSFVSVYERGGRGGMR